MSMIEKRFIYYLIIFISGLMIAAAFMAFNTEYKYLFWPVMIIFGTIFILATQKLVKQL